MIDSTQDYGRVIVCGSPAKFEVESEELHKANAWCFTCRGRHDHIARFYTVPEPAYTDAVKSNMWNAVWMTPYWQIECSNCGAMDGDLGFGRYRED